MRSLSALGSLVAATLLCGCAIKPTPDDTTHLYTNQIANHIRCEAQQAIQSQAIDLLRLYHRDALALNLERGKAVAFTEAFKHYKELDLSNELRDRVSRYFGVAIAYEFTLDVTEDNNDQLQLNLLGPVSGGNGALGLKAGLERSRENVRIFTVADRFDELVQNTTVCAEPPAAINFVYPFSGQILVKETIDNFLDLNELTGLQQRSKGDTQVYSDKFHFRTIVTGGFNPSGALTPSVFGPKDVSLNDTATRTDDHQVIVGISLPVRAESSPRILAPGLFGAVGSASVPANNDAKARAIQAIQDAKVNYFLNNVSGFVVR